MQIQHIIQYLETVAPPIYQEPYDNAGLITGNPQQTCTKALICLDSTENIVDEAIQQNCQLIIAHHPIIFGGLKKITGKNYVEKTIIKAIKNDIALYAIHTNLDNVLQNGVNQKIAQLLELQNCKILLPKPNSLRKITLEVPLSHATDFQNQIQHLPTTHPTLTVLGTHYHPRTNQHLPHLQLHITLEPHHEAILLSNIQNFENKYNTTIPFSVTLLQNPNPQIGIGVIGTLPNPVPELTFLKNIKKQLGATVLKHTTLLNQKIETVALCGGAGSFLLPQAIAQKAQIFISSDFKYHDFFDANQKIIIADIGHYETEQHTIPLLQNLLQTQFNDQAVQFITTTQSTNPVHYL